MTEQQHSVRMTTYRLTYYPNRRFPYELVWNSDGPFVPLSAFRFTRDAANAVVRLNATGSF